MQAIVLGLYLPIVGMELFVFAIAVREGMLNAFRQWAWPLFPTGALLVLVAVAVGTAITAPNPGAARITTFFWLSHLAFGFSVAFLFASRFQVLDLFAAYLAGFALFILGTALFAARVTDPDFDWVHRWPAVTHIRHFGYYAAAMIGMGIGFASVERRKTVLAVLFVFAVASFTFVFWTGSRGAILAVVGTLLISILLMPAVRRAIVWSGTLIALGFGAAITSFLPVWDPLMGVGRAVTQTVSSGDVSTGRIDLWLGVLNAIWKRPIFGYGENQMSTVAPFSDLGQTHEVFLQILLAWGFVGLACVAVLGIWFLIRSLPVVRKNQGALLPPFMAMTALGVLSLYDGALFHVVPVSIFAACAGMIASAWHDPEKRAP